MEIRPFTFILFLCAILAVMGTIVWFIIRPTEAMHDALVTAEQTRLSSKRTPSDLGRGRLLDDRSAREARHAMEDLLALADLDRILGGKDALKNEAVIRFSSREAYDDFLKAAADFGLSILGAQARTNSLRIGFDDLQKLRASLAGLDAGDYEVGANFAVLVPGVPQPVTPENPGQQLLPFGARTLDWLGATGDRSTWGQGITIAILDTGIDPHSTFTDGQVTTIDFLDNGTANGDVYGHGTAVASLAAGSDARAGGLAPAANILSYAVTNAEGVSDSFTLSQAIYDAVDRGANVINISLGSYGDSILLRDAVAFAVEKGVAVVAAAGNEGTPNRLTYPAAYQSVVSVGAVDALGQHVYYSNSGATLSLSAPGVGVVAAWPGNELVTFSGTSASSPYVAGAIAALLSQNKGLSARQAEQLLYQYANEAGSAGADPAFGNGILNIGRVMERATPGIYDIAVASLTFANPILPSNNANATIDVAVQNRGTETVYNIKLEISSTGMKRSFTIPILKPGAVDVRAAPVDSMRARVDGSVQVLSTATIGDSNLQDRNLRDNQASTLISVKTVGP